MNKKQIVSIIIAAIIVISLIIVITGGVAKNNDQNWQVVQSVGGNVTIRDKAGYYLKWFATVWTYPRYVEATVIACQNFRGRARPLTLNLFLFTYLFLLGFFLISVSNP